MATKEWKKDDFIFGDPLGCGQFGNVFYATSVLHEYPVAIKVIHKEKVASELLHIRLKR